MRDSASNPEASEARRPPAAPLFAALLSFSAGILLQQFLYRPPRLYFFCLCGFVLCALLSVKLLRGRRRAMLASAAAALAFLPAGALSLAARQAHPLPAATIFQYSGGEEVTLTGYVARSGSLRSGKDLSESLDLEVEQAQREGESPQAASGRVRLSLYVPGSHVSYESEEEGLEQPVTPPLFDYGQRLRVVAKLRPPTNYRNPGNMDYVSWLRGQGVSVLGSAKSTNINVLPGLGGSPIERLRWRIRRSALEHMQQLWPAPWAGLFEAMVLGERGLVNREQRLEFQRSGTFHLLVVSGMNVAVFAVFLLWMMRRMHLPAEWAMLATVVITCGYAWLTELGAPILRSVLMIAAYQSTALLNRDRAPLNTVALAALALLAWEPAQLFDASFQLTFLAVLTIAGIGVPLFARTTGPLRQALIEVDDTGRDLTLEPRQAQWRLDVRALSESLGRIIGRRPAGWLISSGLLFSIAFFELALLSFLMQISLMLPTVSYFHRVNPRAVWANMAVLPLTAWLMPTAMLGVAFSYLSHWLALPFAWAARMSLAGILWAVHGSGGAHLHDLRVAMPDGRVVAVLAVSYMLALLLARRHRVLASLSVLALAASAWMLYAHPRPFAYRPNAVEITAVDIGQGDCFLLVSPQGHALLLDSGGLIGPHHGDLDIGEDVVSPYLWHRGLQHMEAVAISHSHADHIGGMAAILRNFHPSELWHAADDPSRELVALRDEARKLAVRDVLRHAGESFVWDGVQVQVLWPPAGYEVRPRGQDDSSMVLRVSYNGRSALLVGDIHRRTELELADAAHGRLHVDLLKVPHHGSNTSSSEELLDAVRPEYAVISAGVRNPFHHPRMEVLERLGEHHARVYRTDLLGPVTFYMDATGVRVETLQMQVDAAR
jgi:competence protein ComEC